MDLDYQKEIKKIEELSQNEFQNDKILISFQNNEISDDDLCEKESIILQKQVLILKEKNENYNSIMYKLEKLVQTYIKPMNFSPIVNVDRLDEIQDSQILTSKKIYSEDKEIYGKDLEDDIDKLNNNIELIKKAFNEYERNAAADNLENKIDESEIDFNNEVSRKKEKSLFMMPHDDLENDTHRKFKSFNLLNKANVENALENSTFSISLLNQKLKAYPEKIKSLEEKIQEMNSSLNLNDEKILKLLEEQAKLITKLEEKNIKIIALEEKTKNLENELKEKNSEIIEKSKEYEIFKARENEKLLQEKSLQNMHYQIENSLANLEKDKLRDDKIEDHQKKDCCIIY